MLRMENENRNVIQKKKKKKNLWCRKKWLHCDGAGAGKCVKVLEKFWITEKFVLWGKVSVR